MFYIPIQTCIERVNTRPSHPTLPGGPESEVVIRRQASELRFPERSEGMDFCVSFNQDDDIDSLLDWIINS